MRPHDLPTLEQFRKRHGTRSCYVAGCRCGKCRAANTRRYHERAQRAKELAQQLPPVLTLPIAQDWTAPDGSKQTRFYKRACPGVAGSPCSKLAHLRIDSKGGCCRSCRELLVWDGLVSAEPARLHLGALAKLGVGRRAVQAACDVPDSTLVKIKNGKRQQLRASTAKKILAVTEDARGDASLVSANSTWRRINELMAAGLSEKDLARRLGYKTPYLQFRADKITARNELKVEKLYNQIMTWRDRHGRRRRAA